MRLKAIVYILSYENNNEYLNKLTMLIDFFENTTKKKEKKMIVTYKQLASLDKYPTLLEQVANSCY